MIDAESETPEYLTPMQVAKALNLSYWTILRRFKKEPGVIDVSEKKKPGQRRNRTLRIPRAVLDRFLHEHRIR